MLPVQELPLRAVPFVVFLTACGAFGELFVRMPDNTWPHSVAAWILGFFMVVSGALFFTKVMLDWPRMPGLDLHDTPRLPNL
jgi:hypothetical protein